MKVILLKDVPNVGKANNVVNVSDGYAINYLIKNKLATSFTNSSSKELNDKLQKIQMNHDELVVRATLLKSKLEEKVLEFFLQKNHEDKFFGSINKKQILDKLSNDGIDIDKSLLSNSLKLGIGSHEIKIHIYDKVSAILKVIVKEKN